MSNHGGYRWRRGRLDKSVHARVNDEQESDCDVKGLDRAYISERGLGDGLGEFNEVDARHDSISSESYSGPRPVGDGSYRVLRELTLGAIIIRRP